MGSPPGVGGLDALQEPGTIEEGVICTGPSYISDIEGASSTRTAIDKTVGLRTLGIGAKSSWRVALIVHGGMFGA